MKKYKVTIKEIRTYEFEVEADNKKNSQKEAIQQLVESGSCDSNLHIDIVSRKISKHEKV